MRYGERQKELMSIGFSSIESAQITSHIENINVLSDLSFNNRMKMLNDFCYVKSEIESMLSKMELKKARLEAYFLANFISVSKVTNEMMRNKMLVELDPANVNSSYAPDDLKKIKELEASLTLMTKWKTYVSDMYWVLKQANDNLGSKL
jgi:hypothetical protein